MLSSGHELQEQPAYAGVLSKCQLWQLRYSDMAYLQHFLYALVMLLTDLQITFFMLLCLQQDRLHGARPPLNIDPNPYIKSDQFFQFLPGSLLNASRR